MNGDLSLEKNKIIGAALIDLSKAFDSACHTTLQEKLSLYGFHGDSLQWLKSYLHGRRQRVVFGREMSEWTDVCTGVSQESILGPLLSISIFVNDLPEVLSRRTVMMHADR